MENFLDKISSYHLVNYLLPGILFCVALNMYDMDTSMNSLVVSISVYYFCGMLLSRFGSLLIEPIIRKLIKHTEYEDYIEACNKDSKIEVLVETNNLYRTLLAAALVLLLVRPYMYLAGKFAVFSSPTMLFSILLLIFIISYIKQTKIVIKRINKANNYIDKES
jgi:hypothetical protein